MTKKAGTQYFAIIGNGNWGLYYGETDGKNTDGQPADEIRVSPDGQWALTRISGQLYVFAVPRMGGDAPVVNLDKAVLPLRKLSDVGAWGLRGRGICSACTQP